MNRASRVMTLITACLAVLTFSAAEQEPAISLVGIPAGIIAWLLRQRSSRSIVPRVFINAIIFVLVGYAVRDAWLNAITVSQVGLLIVSLLIVKLFDRASSRDEAQVLMLSVFLVIGSMLQSIGLSVGLMTLMFIPICVLAIMLYQLASGSEAAAGSMRPPPHAVRPFAAPDPAMGSRSWRHFSRLCTGAVTTIVCIAMIVFVLFPRGIGANMFGTIGRAQSQETGFSDDVDLIQIGGISQSDRVVMTVQLTNERGENIGAEASAHYLRGAVLTHYDNGKWTGDGPSAGREILSDQHGSTRSPLLDRRRGPLVRQRVTMMGASPGNSYLFALYKPVRLTLDAPADVRHMSTTGRLVAQHMQSTASYTVDSVRSTSDNTSETFDLGTTPGVDFASDVVRSKAAQVLEAASIETDLAWRTPAQRIGAATVVRDYLRGAYGYSLTPPNISNGTDPIEWFIENGKEAHCEFFASCMTAMCRSVGVPARMVTGYVAAEWNNSTKSYTVRASNAHAWVEVLGADGEWVTMDPTPPADFVRLHQPPPSMFRNIRQIMDAINHYWVTSIMSFGERGTASANQGEWFQSVAERIETERYNNGGSMVRAVLRWLTPVAIGIALIFVALQLHRHRLWGSILRLFGRHDTRADVLPAYPRLLRVLAARRVPKPTWRSPIDHANAIRFTDPAAADTLETIAHLYYLLKFGHARPNADDVRRAGRLVRELAATPRTHS